MDETLRIRIIAEIERLQQGLSTGKRLIDNFSDEAQDALAEVNNTIQKVGDKSKSVFKAMTGLIAGLGTAFLALGDSTKEYREGQAKLKTAFQTAGASAETAKSTYNDLYRVLGDDATAVEAANHLAKLTTNQEELAEYTNICKGVYATFGDSLPIESLTEAINHTAKVGEVQGSLADALEWSGVNMDEFNEQLFWCNSESEREKLIRDTLNGMYSDAASNYETNAEGILKQNEAQLRLNEATAKLGEAAAPVMTLLAELGTKVLAELEPHLDDITVALTSVAEAIGNVISWIADHWELVSTLGTVILVVAGALSVFSTVMGIVNAVMMASPITWIVLGIVAAIAALVAIIVVVIKYWDEIKAAVVNAVNAIVNAVKTAWDWLVNLFSSVGGWIYSNLIQPIGNFFVGLWEGIKSVFSAAGSWFNSTVIQPIVNFFTNMWNKLKGGAKNAWEGIKSVFSSVASFFSNIFTKAWEGVKKVFSTGGKIFSGIKDGIVSAFKTIVNAIIKGINKVVALPFKGINAALSKIKGIEIFNIKPFSWVHTINIPQIPLLERGGVLKKGQIGLLEGNGAEAVVPLENNTEWLDKIASRLIEGLGGSNTPIILQVDGTTFAKTSINTINKLTRQQGKLGLNLV